MRPLVFKYIRDERNVGRIRVGSLQEVLHYFRHYPAKYGNTVIYMQY